MIRITGINTNTIIRMMITKMLNVLKKLSLVISKLCLNDSTGFESSSTIKQTQKIERRSRYNIKHDSKTRNITSKVSYSAILRSINRLMNNSMAINMP